mgnify:CR=1 FL=1
MSDSEKPVLKYDLAAIDELSALTDENIELFNSKVTCKRYKAGQTIFMQDDACEGLYFVEQGLIAVRKVDREGRTAVVRLGFKGDTLGYRPMLAKEHHRASADVIKAATVCFIDSKTMLDILYHNPDLGMKFLERMAKALGDVEERFFEVAALNVRIRLVHLLLLLYNRFGRISSDGMLILELPLTRRDMASMIGAQPESVSRTIHDLQAEGLANFSGRNVHVPQYDRLVEELHSGLNA